MRRSPTRALGAVVVSLLLACGAIAVAQSDTIIGTPHNLSASGPGIMRAVGEQQVCIFCHTPHSAAPIQPLWNRSVPVNAYTVYSSNSLNADVGQPTGSSKLCLSCHDGTIAVGSVLSRDQPIAMAGGMTTIPAGSSGNLGTDLSDDHPVSFVYDSALAVRDGQLRDPAALNPSLRLDANSEMQCTTCHDPHNNRFGKFLVMDNSSSQMCASCHIKGPTNVTEHQGCASCHMPHTAPSGPHLLRGETVSDTCLQCHSGGQMHGADIASDLQKPSRHDVRVSQRSLMTGPAGDSVMCNDCHGSHTMNSGTAAAPAISPKLGQISGVGLAGNALAAAQNQYEVCFKCHGDQAVTQPTISRQIVQTNTRLQFSPTAVSYHPVAAAGRSNDVPSLRPGLTTASLVYCTDCHASDSSPVAGASGAAGPHGSTNRPLLARRYETTDYSNESEDAYSLCYSCHDRSSILGNESFSAHSLHIVNAQTPCSACHDPHGIPSAQGNAINHSRLMNFDTRIVRPASNGQLEFRSTGVRTGECTLSCHGKDHVQTRYP